VFENGTGIIESQIITTVSSPHITESDRAFVVG
jgi:hypothetical protein